MKVETCLWELRNERNISLKQLELRSGISKSTLSRIENQKTCPTLLQLVNIADVFKVDYNTLIRIIR